MSNENERFCAPSKGKDKYTCYTYDSLVKIAHKWNQENPESPIEESLFRKSRKRELYKAIQKRLEKGAPCTKEYCWNKHPIVEDLNDPEIVYETFRPEKPLEWYQNHKAWLSTTDIQHVLLQYEDKYPEFFFVGPVPIDFDKKLSRNKCISDELCHIDIKKLYKDGKRYIGVVFNLDPHDAPGSHWVSLFIDLNNGGVYYYDSVGKFPTNEVVKLMQRVVRQGNNAISSGFIDRNTFKDDHSTNVKVKATQGNKIIVDNKSKGKAHPFLVGMPAFAIRPSSGGRNSEQKLIVENIEDGVITFNRDVDPNTREIDIIGFRLFYNDITHQLENTECGVYSIDFISSLLQGDSFQNYTANVKRDNALNRLRNIFYRPAINKLN